MDSLERNFLFSHGRDMRKPTERRDKGCRLLRKINTSNTNTKINEHGVRSGKGSNNSDIVWFNHN